ncbi:embryonic polarity protein dorsal-like [Maniola jurtina]|uniref:embryonic polarity protein dorsal-like n=1 Tax=Maniola jurtina TaxID=191418 RepID=UPI001E68641A|nr:embryonic polarity protein dorsal-like [Maniola jurtina]
MILGGLIRAVDAMGDRVDPLVGVDPLIGAEPLVGADPLVGASPCMGPEAMPRQLAPLPGQPHVRIVEQPAKTVRFRYPCEGRLAGSVQGVNSRPPMRRTYPTIEICNCKGLAIIVVSCVTTEDPYKPHPHNLVGRENCENGVCIVKITIAEDNRIVSFNNMGIQCVKRKGIAKSLNTRRWLRVDPFRTGFNHSKEPQSIDLNAVRLCFQVFIRDEHTNCMLHSLPPVVSDIIYDKKAMNELIITCISRCSGSMNGDTRVILLCERVTKEDVMVVFFQKEGDRTVWEANANVVLVHRQYAVVFQTPPYRNPNEQNHVQVYLQLKRTSDGVRSNAIPFEYIPSRRDTGQYLRIMGQKPLSSHLLAYQESMTPPHQTSPRSVFSPSHQQGHDNYQQHNLNLPGASHMGYNQDMQWQQTYTHLPQLSLNLPSMASNLQPMPNYLQQSTVQPIQSMPPAMQMSPMEKVMPPVDGISPMTHGEMPSSMVPESPIFGHDSPTVGHISPDPIQQQVQHELMEASPATDTLSITGLLMECGEECQLSSGELSAFSALLDARGADLSDSLSRLSTSDDLLGAVVSAMVL